MGDDGDESRDPKAELFSRLNDLLEQLASSKPRLEPSSRLQKTYLSLKSFLQSKFFVAILSGFLLWLLPYLWQERAAKHRAAEEQERQTAERRDRLAYQFAREFPLTLHLAGNFRKRQLWMQQSEARDEAARYKDGRSFAETREHTEKLIEQYFSLGPAASTCNQIFASFSDSPNIRDLTVKLNGSVNALLLATNDTGVDIAFDGANASYQLLTGAIFAELNKSNENRNDPH